MLCARTDHSQVPITVLNGSSMAYTGPHGRGSRLWPAILSRRIYDPRYGKAQAHAGSVRHGKYRIGRFWRLDADLDAACRDILAA